VCDELSLICYGDYDGGRATFARKLTKHLVVGKVKRIGEKFLNTIFGRGGCAVRAYSAGRDRSGRRTVLHPAHTIGENSNHQATGALANQESILILCPDVALQREPGDRCAASTSAPRLPGECAGQN